MVAAADVERLCGRRLCRSGEPAVETHIAQPEQIAVVHICPSNIQSNSMKRDFSVVIERDSEGYYVASVPGLPGCHTQARSLDELMERVREAIELCLEVEQTEAERLDFVGIQKITVAG